MKTLAAGGTAAGIPAFGGGVSLAEGDVAQILSAGTGLVKTLTLGAAGLGLGVLILRALVSDEEQLKPVPKTLKIPLDSSLVIVETELRHFWGVTLDDEVGFECEGYQFKAPLRVVNGIFRSGGDDAFNLETVDGSLYKNITLESEMNFVTVLGQQKVRHQDVSDGSSYYGGYPVIQAATITQVEQLKRNLQEVLSYNLNDIINIIGKDVFQQFFQINQFPKLVQKLNP